MVFFSPTINAMSEFKLSCGGNHELILTRANFKLTTLSYYNEFSVAIGQRDLSDTFGQGLTLTQFQNGMLIIANEDFSKAYFAINFNQKLINCIKLQRRNLYPQIPKQLN